MPLSDTGNAGDAPPTLATNAVGVLGYLRKLVDVMVGIATGLQVQGTAADGAAVSGNPVRIGGKDGAGLTQDIITDTSGNLAIVGTAATATPTVGAPVRIGGRESGTATTRDILTDSSGVMFAKCVGNAAVDAAAAGNPVLTAGRASSATPAAVSADGDVVTPWLDRKGRTVAAAVPGDDGDIVAGSATVADATIITVTAGRTWMGTITVSGSIVNTNNAAAEAASVWVETAGANVVPAAATQLARISMNIAITTATSTSGNGQCASVSMPGIIVRAPAGNSVTLVLKESGTASAIAATACGQLM